MMKRALGSASWRIGDLAKATGVSADTLRHYERKGVLHSLRAGNGYREYSENALERVRMIRQALAVGFTLTDWMRYRRKQQDDDEHRWRFTCWEIEHRKSRHNVLAGEERKFGEQRL